MAVGIGLLEAAAKGAVANVRINLGSLLDEGFKASASADVDAIYKQLCEDAAAANAALEGNQRRGCSSTISARRRWVPTVDSYAHGLM